jgi:hypothetical protein
MIEGSVFLLEVIAAMFRTMLSGCILGGVLGGCAPEGAGPAYVSFNVKLDAECVARPEPDVVHPQGVFDVAAYEFGCASSYDVNLIVNSNLRRNFDEAQGRAEPNVLHIHSAEVWLTTISDQPLAFPGELPNPFLVTSNTTIDPSPGSGEPVAAIASVEAIPAAYRDYLGDFTGGMIRAKIQLFGTTTGDVDIETPVFTYPIEICEGCLLLAEASLPEDKTVDEILAGECDEAPHLGVDGRQCIIYGE